MTIKELIPKLIEHYEKCINEMPEEGWLRFLLQNNVDCGICNAANLQFRKMIYHSVFVEEYVGNTRSYLCNVPAWAESYSEAKELLQIRLNRLKEFL